MGMKGNSAMFYPKNDPKDYIFGPLVPKALLMESDVIGGKSIIYLRNYLRSSKLGIWVSDANLVKLMW